MKFLLVIVLSLAINTVSAQYASNSSYFVYRISVGETFHSIAGLYNLTPKQLADYNNLDYYEGPLRSKTIRIPLKTINNHAKDNSQKEKKQKKTVIPIPPTTNEVPLKEKEKTITKNAEPVIIEQPQQVPVVKDTIKPQAIIATIEDTIKPPPVADTQLPRKKEVLKEKNVRPSLQELVPLLIFLAASLALLIAAIFFYRAAKK